MICLDDIAIVSDEKLFVRTNIFFVRTNKDLFG